MSEMKFPITVKAIKFGDLKYKFRTRSGAACGDMVAVRPCDEECQGKTYLGIMLGDFPLSIGCSFDAKTKTLTASAMMHNPAMFVPALKRIIWGCGSFWSKITSEDQLRQITDEDISNIWYIKALRESLAQGSPDGETPQADKT